MALKSLFEKFWVDYKQVYPSYSRMTFLHKIYFNIVHFVDTFYAWHKLPVFFGLIYLELRRTLEQHYNLVNVGGTPVGMRYNPVDFPYRTENGVYNDPFDKDAGEEGSFFGRNMKPSPQADKLLEPHPSVVATKLLARRKFVDTGKQFNMLAASWIQFMIHDWVDHLEDTQQAEIVAPKSVASQCPLKKFRFPRTKEIPTGFYDIKTGHKNVRTPWWDGSVIYGSNKERLKNVRTFQNGKLKLNSDGLLEHMNDGVAISGDVRNSWAGVSILQALFSKEHNAVCDKLKENYPEFDDEELYRHARLVVSAVIAKIHTIDWTVELLKTDTNYAGMFTTWYGTLGKKFKESFGHTGNPILSGLVGMPKPINHGVPYSLTEEFVSVYRLHALLPEKIAVRDLHGQAGENKTPPVSKEVPMPELIGIHGEDTLSGVGNETMIVSMGHQACGALSLWNYPLWMRDMIAQDLNGQNRADHVDMPALEIYRDRERSVPRYNDYRRGFLMTPIRKWEDLTDDKEAISVLKEVYGNNVEMLDLQVGLMAERKIKGFAISESAFFLFLLTATRRLEADRFFTSDFTEEVYTKVGMDWINSIEGIKDVIGRHHKDIVAAWLNAPSAFSVWSAEAPPVKNIPVLLRPSS